jgi:hypothetical protein
VGDGCEWRAAVDLGLRRHHRGRAWRSAMGKRQCELEGCSKWAASGGTPHCIAHGGGKRCQHEGCIKAAAGGGTLHCRAHGGGKRCQEEGCSKSAQGDTGFCIAHGGGRRCQTEDCLKSARGDTGHCSAHGGGRRCQTEDCLKSARGDTQHWRMAGEALPAKRLHHVSSRRYAALLCAWRWQALPDGGLLQGGSCRRHASLVMNLQSSILMAQMTDPSSWH